MSVPEPPELGLSPLPRVDLDQLLTELLDRVGEVVSSRERLRALLDAVVGIGTDLDLRSTLERIVVSASHLVGAKYGAIGVIGDDRQLVEFITHGLSGAEHAAIGDLPRGRGVLGLLIDDPRPVRMPDITQHPRSFGFPDHHPPMHSFLGVPVRIGDRIYGNLYLAEKQGEKEFTPDDEEVVVALAAAAGVAIDNARLYSVAQRRHRWLTAATEITQVLVGQVRRNQALELIARRAREVASAELVLILLHDEDAGVLTVEVADFAEPSEHSIVGTGLAAAETLFAPALDNRAHLVLDDLSQAAPWPVAMPRRPAAVVPLATSETLYGLLVMVSTPGDQVDLFDRDEDQAMLTAFAGQAALAFERALAHEEREMFVILEDRERIARDLHDVVIQRLFATGMQLQTAGRLAAKPEVAARINAAVDDLDSTIRDIRSAIFELRTPMSAEMRGEIRDLVSAVGVQLGFRPTLELVGPIDSAVPSDLRADALAVLREALSNVVRHAAATEVLVVVRISSGTLTISVTDNGAGIPEGVELSGLNNLRGRAADRDGSFDISPGPAGGTVLEWCVAL